MKAGRAMDSMIATKVMGLKAIEPDQIPQYSTDIFAAHKIITKLQQQGWFCNVGSRIGNDGNLFYCARFYQHGRECERYAPTIPLAICSAAESVVQEEYFEYIDILEKPTDEVPIKIIPGKTTGFSSIDTEEEVANIIKNSVEENNNLINSHDWLILAKNIIDKLSKSGYIIIKKPPNNL